MIWRGAHVGQALCVCAHKAAEILPDQSFAVFAASHTQNLGWGRKES